MVTQSKLDWCKAYAEWVQLNIEFNAQIKAMHEGKADYPLELSEKEYQAGKAAKFAWERVEIEMQVGRLLEYIDSLAA